MSTEEHDTKLTELEAGAVDVELHDEKERDEGLLNPTMEGFARALGLKSPVKHTPGPWHVGATNDALFIIDQPPRPSPIDHHNDTLRTRVIAKVTEPHEEGWTQEQYRSHARLIAAAPDLYKQLEHLVSLMEPLEREGGLMIPGLATLNGAREALAKAKGAQ